MPSSKLNIQNSLRNFNIPSAADSINFVEENKTSLLGAGHLEEFAHHPCTLSYVLLHKLRSNDSNKASVRPEKVNLIVEDTD